MTDKEKQELYENICKDISCGTYILAPQYVDELLARFEEENKELKRDRQNLRADLRTARNNLQAKDTVYQLAMQENTELKKEVSDVRQHLDLTETEWGKDTTKLIHYKTQFTKAKEIIKSFLSAHTDDLITEAEQLLKENE